MPVRTDNLPPVREPKSVFDHHAIGAAGRLVTTGVWLECRLTTTANRWTTFIDGFIGSVPASRLVRTSIQMINQPRNEKS
jgi:hypothetical protein